MFSTGKKHTVEVLRDIIRDQVLTCQNTISLSDLNDDNQKPEPMGVKILLTVK